MFSICFNDCHLTLINHEILHALPYSVGQVIYANFKLGRKIYTARNHVIYNWGIC